jgi:hypothetical protein
MEKCICITIYFRSGIDITTIQVCKKKANRFKRVPKKVAKCAYWRQHVCLSVHLYVRAQELEKEVLSNLEMKNFAHICHTHYSFGHDRTIITG